MQNAGIVWKSSRNFKIRKCLTDTRKVTCKGRFYRQLMKKFLTKALNFNKMVKDWIQPVSAFHQFGTGANKSVQTFYIGNSHRKMFLDKVFFTVCFCIRRDDLISLISNDWVTRLQDYLLFWRRTKSDVG